MRKRRQRFNVLEVELKHHRHRLETVNTKPARKGNAKPGGLLRDMNLLFLVNVTQEIDQPANEGYDRQP